ncbi:MAG: hypothetical protein ACM3NV_02805 [Syntrophothermus sp.]
MAQILVVTDAPDGSRETLFSERLDAVHLESRQSGEQLLERVRWALRDAQSLKRRDRLRRRGRARSRRTTSESQRLAEDMLAAAPRGRGSE